MNENIRRATKRVPRRSNKQPEPVRPIPPNEGEPSQPVIQLPSRSARETECSGASLAVANPDPA